MNDDTVDEPDDALCRSVLRIIGFVQITDKFWSRPKTPGLSRAWGRMFRVDRDSTHTHLLTQWLRHMGFSFIQNTRGDGRTVIVLMSIKGVRLSHPRPRGEGESISMALCLAIQAWHDACIVNDACIVDMGEASSADRTGS